MRDFKRSYFIMYLIYLSDYIKNILKRHNAHDTTNLYTRAWSMSKQYKKQKRAIARLFSFSFISENVLFAHD